MNRALIYTDKMFGLGLACLEIARRLNAMGIAVLHAAPLVLCQRLEENGVEALAVEGDLGVDPAPFVRALETFQPDFVLIDIELHAALIESLARGLRAATLSPWLAIWKARGLPPLHKAVSPRDGELRMEASWAKYRLRKTMERARGMQRKRLRSLRTLASSRGVNFDQAFSQQEWLIPASCRALPLLCLHAAELDFPHAAPDYVRYVGPMVRMDRREPPLAPADAERLQALLDRRHERPLAVAALGSFFNTDPAFLERLVAAFRMSPDLEFLVSYGAEPRPEVLRAPPPNVHAFPWLPQLQVLNACSLAIVHGGVNTIEECIATGAPMCAFSGGMTDMHGNVARVVHHGLGLAGRLTDTPEAMAKLFGAVRADRDIPARLADMRAAGLRYEAERVFERAIEELLQ